MSFNYGLRHGAVLKLTSGNSSTASDVFTAGTQYIRVVSTIDCHIAVSKAPTAAITTTFLPAKEVETIKVSPGEKVAALGGNNAVISIVEMGG